MVSCLLNIFFLHMLNYSCANSDLFNKIHWLLIRHITLLYAYYVIKMLLEQFTLIFYLFMQFFLPRQLPRLPQCKLRHCGPHQKSEGEPRCSCRISSSSFLEYTRCVTHMQKFYGRYTCISQMAMDLLLFTYILSFLYHWTVLWVTDVF